MLLSHFVTSLTTAVFSSLLAYHRNDFCVGNCVASANPTVVTCPKMIPPCIAAGWLPASHSYELLRGSMLQLKEAQKRKIIYLASFVAELMLTPLLEQLRIAALSHSWDSSMRRAPILWRVIAGGIQPAIHGTGSCSWTLRTPREERFARTVTSAFEVAKPFAQTCKLC